MLTKIILTVIVLAGAGLTRLIFNAVLIRRFGPELLGNINLSISTAFLFSLFVTAGLCPAAAKYISQYAGRNDEKNSKRSFTIILFSVLILSMIVSLLMFVNSKRLAQLMNGKPIWFAKASLVVFLYSLYLFCKRAYYGIDKVATYFKNEIFADAVFFLTLVILVLFNLVSLLIMPFILFYSVFLLWALYAQRSWISLSLCTKISKIRKNLKEIMSFSSISLVGTLSSMGGRHISTMLTGTYTSAKEVGYYSTSLSVTMALYLVASAVSMVLFPLMSRYYGRKDYASITSTLGNFSRWLLIVSSFLCGIALIFSRFIFNVVTGTDYRIGVFALQILIVGAYIGISGVPSISTLSGTKYVHIPNAAALLGLALSLVSWKMLIPRYGIIGTALGLVVLSTTITSIAMYYAQKIFFPQLFKNLKVVLFSGCVLLSSLLFGKYVFRSPAYSQIASGLLFALMFISIYKNELRVVRKRIEKEMIIHRVGLK